VATDGHSTPTRLRRVGHAGASCYAWFLGYKIVKTEWEDSLCRWFFEDGKELRDAIDGFFAGTAQVDPREYFPRVVEFKRNMYWDNPLRKEAKAAREREVTKD
jgi:hypothetical protein